MASVKRPDTRGEKIRQARRTLAVALAFARAKCLLDVLMEEVGRAKAEGVKGPMVADWRALRVTRGTRAATLVIVYYSMLQSVIDGWQRNHLKNSQVDELLASEHTRTLGNFRNAILHPMGAAEERFTRMGEVHKELMPWALDLMKAFNTYFGKWFKTGTEILEQVQKRSG